MMTNRPDNIFQLMGGQLNGMCSRGVRDRKLRQIEIIINQWDIQACCFQEVGVNWAALPQQERMDSWFCHGHADMTTSTTHNIHAFGPRQKGGVAIIIGDELHTYAKEREPDFRGLGRWCSWRIYSSPGYVTCIVSAYNLGKQKSKHLGTIYQQHKLHTQITGITLEPQQLFINDFLSQILVWQKAGEWLLIFADMNKHILTGKLTQQLLAMVLEEATHKQWSGHEPNSFIDGTLPINGLYHSKELKVMAVIQLSFHE